MNTLLCWYSNPLPCFEGIEYLNGFLTEEILEPFLDSVDSYWQGAVISGRSYGRAI